MQRRGTGLRIVALALLSGDSFSAAFAKSTDLDDYYAGLTDYEHTVTFRNVATGQLVPYKKSAGSYCEGRMHIGTGRNDAQRWSCARTTVLLEKIRAEREATESRYRGSARRTAARRRPSVSRGFRP